MNTTMRSARHDGPRGPVINSYKLGAVLAQLGSFVTTYAFFVAVLTDAPYHMVLLIAIGTEALLGLGKSLLFNTARQDDAVGWSAIIFDTLLNAGGIWPYSMRIAATPTAVMLSQAFNLQGEMTNLPALVLSLVFGYLLAVLPWRLWRAGSRRRDDD